MSFHKTFLFSILLTISLLSAAACEHSVFPDRKGILGNWQPVDKAKFKASMEKYLLEDSLVNYSAEKSTVTIDGKELHLDQTYENENFVCIRLIVDNHYITFYLIISKKPDLQIKSFVAKEYWPENRIDLVFFDNKKLTDVLVLNNDRLSSTFENIRTDTTIFSLITDEQRFSLENYGLTGLKLFSLQLSSRDRILKLVLNKHYDLLKEMR